MEKEWIFKPEANQELIGEISKSINISKPLANLLAQRGITTYEQAQSFFRPSLKQLHDPFLMKDMDSAVSRLTKAVENNEKILIYGDYDVDGTTSVALMYSFLQSRVRDLLYYIPDRYGEGYGVSKKGIDFASEKGCSLIIALDCGIKAIDKVDYATSKNIDFIICDHHEADGEIPNAVAVLNPKRPDCGYPFNELSGCGVGFKLIQAYAMKNNVPFCQIEYNLDLVAISIACDMVPIVDENRILAYYGLNKLNTYPRIGVKALLDIAKLSLGNLKISDLVFKIGPRINAAGRMEQGIMSVDLLVCNDRNNAVAIAEKIDEDNKERRWFDTNITKQALDLIKQDLNYSNKKATVLYNPEWHKGVVGIVASRVIEHYYKPSVILTRANGFVTGSARSVSGFDLYSAVEKCRDLLENFGGHTYAAGLTLKEENVEAFKEKFEKIVAEQITKEHLTPKIEIDSVIEIDDIKPNFYNVLRQFEPFGPGNMSPVFVSKNVNDTGYAKLVGAEREHLKLTIGDQESESVFSAIAFKQSKAFDLVEGNNIFDVCYSLEENEFRGRRNIQMKVKDIKAPNRKYL